MDHASRTRTRIRRIATQGDRWRTQVANEEARQAIAKAEQGRREREAKALAWAALRDQERAAIVARRQAEAIANINRSLVAGAENLARHMRDLRQRSEARASERALA